MLYATSICQLKFCQSKMHVIPLTLPVAHPSDLLETRSCAASQKLSYPVSPALRKDQNSKFTVWFLLNAHWLPPHEVKVPVLKHCQQGPSAFVIEHK